MEIPYLVALIVGTLFIVLFIIYIVLAARLKVREDERRKLMEKSYLNANSLKIDYDFASYDEETEKLLKGMQKEEGQLTIDEVITSVAPAVEDVMFTKVDKEEPEEITGNYKPE